MVFFSSAAHLHTSTMMLKYKNLMSNLTYNIANITKAVKRLLLLYVCSVPLWVTLAQNSFFTACKASQHRGWLQGKAQCTTHRVY